MTTGPFRLKDTSNEQRAYVLLRLLLGLLFVAASAQKIYDPHRFAAIVAGYDLLPQVLVNPVALILPWVEAICGIFLISGRLAQGALLVIDILLVIFIIALLISIYRGIDISCGCLSLTAGARWQLVGSMLRDLVLLLIGIWTLNYKMKTDSLSTNGLHLNL